MKKKYKENEKERYLDWIVVIYIVKIVFIYYKILFCWVISVLFYVGCNIMLLNF